MRRRFLAFILSGCLSLTAFSIFAGADDGQPEAGGDPMGQNADPEAAPLAEPLVINTINGKPLPGTLLPAAPAVPDPSTVFEAPRSEGDGNMGNNSSQREPASQPEETPSDGQ